MFPIVAASRSVRRVVARVRRARLDRTVVFARTGVPAASDDELRDVQLEAVNRIFDAAVASGALPTPEVFVKMASEQAGIRTSTSAAELSSFARTEQRAGRALEVLLEGWVRRDAGAFSALFEFAAISDLRGDPLEGYVRWRMAETARPPEVSREVTRTVEGRVAALSATLKHPEEISDNAYEIWLDAEHGPVPDAPRVELPAEHFLAVVRHPPGVSRSEVEATVNSVLAQSHGEWRVVVLRAGAAGEHSDQEERSQLLIRGATSLQSISESEVIGGFAEALSKILSANDFDWAVILDAGDVLSRDASEAVMSLLEVTPGLSGGNGLIYFDEDLQRPDGRRHRPYFKPPRVGDILWSHDVLGTAVLLGAIAVRRLGGLSSELETTQLWDLSLRAWRDGVNFYHIPRVLLHRSVHAEATNSSAILVEQVERRMVVRRSLGAHGLSGEVREVGRGGYLQVKLSQAEPLRSVAIIIPTRDGLDVLKPCLQSIFALTDYDAYSVYVIDNGSQLTETKDYLKSVVTEHGVFVIQVKEPFNFSRLLNLGVEATDADVIVSVNNDVVVLQTDWLTQLAAHALRGDVGAVGPRLLYPDGSVQHAGVILGRGGIAGHAYARASRGAAGYRGEAVVQREVSAVTGAVLAIERQKYRDVGGFDEVNLGVALNDVDFCLRLRERGLRNIYVPSVELFHVESHTRKSDLVGDGANRFAKEAAYLRTRHATALLHDPLTNSNRRVSMGEYAI